MVHRPLRNAAPDEHFDLRGTHRRRARPTSVYDARSARFPADGHRLAAVALDGESSAPSHLVMVERRHDNQGRRAALRPGLVAEPSLRLTRPASGHDPDSPQLLDIVSGNSCLSSKLFGHARRQRRIAGRFDTDLGDPVPSRSFAGDHEVVIVLEPIGASLVTTVGDRFEHRGLHDVVVGVE